MTEPRSTIPEEQPGPAAREESAGDTGAEPWSAPKTEPVHHHFTARDGLRLHYLEWPAERPDAPVLALMHGRRAHARWFDTVVAAFEGRCRIVSLDLRGHGESESDGPMSLVKFGADAADWLKLFAGSPVALLAHSMAGRIALLAISREGARPDWLVLADAPLFRKPHHDRPEPVYRAKHYPSLEEGIRRFRLLPAGTSAPPDLLEYVAMRSLRQEPEGTWTWRFDEIGTSRPPGAIPDLGDLGLEAVACPALVIFGRHSDLVSWEEARAVARDLPRGEVVEMTEGYHHLMLDRPATFNREIEAFLLRRGFPLG